MNLNEELRVEISRTINTLRRRYANTADAEEEKVILKTIDGLNAKLSVLNRASLLAAAQVLTDATEAVEGVIAAARKGPFDGYLGMIEDHLNRLYRLSGEMHAFDALPPAPEPEGAAEATRPTRALRRDMGLPPPLASKDFSQLKDEYRNWFDACTVRPEQQGSVAYYVKRLQQGRPHYEQVGQELNIPWYFIGVIHGMECGFNFNGHLHNGDPLTARTVNWPPGRPVVGDPPFTWRQSARDALVMKGYHQVSDWSLPHILYLLEKYNGFGYRLRQVPTPYLWSFSNLYSKGKFVRDRVYDPNAVSKQCGAALMLKAVVPATRGLARGAAAKAATRGVTRGAARGAGKTPASRKRRG
jgi:lysozyme family protein